MEEGEGGSTSSRVSQEFPNTCNICEHNGLIDNPTRRISFFNISTNGRVGSVRKVKKIASVHTQASVGPKFPISTLN